MAIIHIGLCGNQHFEFGTGLWGAILGDIIGSPYEFDCNNHKSKDFPLFSEYSRMTDDTVMTLAAAEGLMNGYGDERRTADEIIKSMQKYGRKFAQGEYGGNFALWLTEENPKPYGSFGNGSAMRVSSAAWLYNTLEDVLKYAKISAEVTHNHPEGIKGAQAAAAAIFLARTGTSKAEIKEYIEKNFGYDLDLTCDEIRPIYHHVESCQETVPEAIIAFIEGESFEDVIRTAVSLGGDSDTLTCISGSIAEGYYGVSNELKEKALSFIPKELESIIYRYSRFISKNRTSPNMQI